MGREGGRGRVRTLQELFIFIYRTIINVPCEFHVLKEKSARVEF
jgi:hypothetical protein